MPSSGEDMVPILKGLGATDEDFSYLKSISDLTDQIQLWTTAPSPTAVTALTSPHAAFSVSSNSPTRSPCRRATVAMNLEFRGHTALAKALVFQDIPIIPRNYLEYSATSWICTLFNSCTHTDTRTGLQGEPALKGIHSDGSDHTMTVFLGSDNKRPDSAVTFMHDNRETTGVALGETNPALIRARVQHRGFLDTLMFVDNDFKHSVTSVYAVDEKRVAIKDMLVIFTRKPKVEGHVLGYADTMHVHEGAPLEVPMWLP